MRAAMDNPLYPAFWDRGGRGLTHTMDMRKELSGVDVQAHEVLVQTLEQAVDAVVMLDEYNHITLFNAAAEALWGQSRGTLLGQDIALLLPRYFLCPQEALNTIAPLDAPHTHAGKNIDVVIDHSDGQPRNGLMSLSRVRVGDTIRYTAFIKDVTEQRRQQAHLQRLSMVVHESHNAIIVTDPQLRVEFVNAGVTRLLGYELADMQGKRPIDFLATPHADEQTSNLLHQQLMGLIHQGGGQLDAMVYTRAGKPLWVSAVVNPVFDADGRMIHALGVLTDITHTKMHEVLLHKGLHAMAHELPMLDIMLLICREVERIAPEVVTSILSVEAGVLRPLAAPSLPAHIAQAFDGVVIGPSVGSCGTSAWFGEPVLATDIATDPRWIGYHDVLHPLGLKACWSNPIKGGDGRVLGTFAFYYREHRAPDSFHRQLIDVSLHLCALLLEREEVRSRIHQLAHYDTLTGLPNRAMLRDRITESIVTAQQSGQQVALALIDLDHFKQVNDTYGHTIGDDLLRELARRFKAAVRNAGTVGRLSGDEFVALLPSTGVELATQAAERLTWAGAQPLALGDVPLRASVSLGVAIFPDDGTDADTLLRHCGLALKQAKAAGGDGFRFFSTDMNRMAQERTMLETSLRLALQQGGLALHYQPQVGAPHPHPLCGVEALLRWQHPILGNIAPPRFIALAEEHGLIHELGQWVLQTACAQMADWRQRGIEVPRVAVNLSARNFQHKGLPGLVARLLEQHRLQPSDLALEITEGAMLDPDPTVTQTIAAVHALGVPLSVDDFGTGYSSLGYLHRLPISELKLDKSFVHDIGHSDTARALTTAVLRIGDSLNLPVVAEGVETESQRAFLAEHGCPVLQGYLFGRPMHADDLERWLAERQPCATAEPASTDSP